MRRRFRAGALALGGAGLLLFSMLLVAVAADRNPVLLRSLESRTREGAPVYNRIAWFPGWKQDIWVMQQSHAGLEPPFHAWDRLAIVLDKTASVARFYQLEPGELQWSARARQLPYRAACFMCHSDGPRAIRPDFAAGAADGLAISLKDRLRLLVWNARIKTYGRVLADPAQVQAKASEPTPFRYLGPFENEKLQARTCALCHNEHAWGRGTLTRQNFMAIGFMVSNGFMPPPGFRASEAEKREIALFVRGLPTSPAPKRPPGPP